MKIYSTPGLDLDDLVLAPGYTELTPKSDMSFKTRITRNVYMDFPVVFSLKSDISKKVNSLGGIVFADVEEFKSGTEFPCGLKVTLDTWESALDLEVERGVVWLGVAHADDVRVVKAMETLKQETEYDVLVGSVGVPEAASRLLMHGADGIVVGDFPSKRIGVPLATAIDACVGVCYGENVPVCAMDTHQQISRGIIALGLGASSLLISGPIYDIGNRLRNAFYYTGSSDLNEYHRNCVFIQKS